MGYGSVNLIGCLLFLSFSVCLHKWKKIICHSRRKTMTCHCLTEFSHKLNTNVQFNAECESLFIVPFFHDTANRNIDHLVCPKLYVL
jgi:hypothetical protein